MIGLNSCLSLLILLNYFWSSCGSALKLVSMISRKWQIQYGSSEVWTTEIKNNKKEIILVCCSAKGNFIHRIKEADYTGKKQKPLYQAVSQYTVKYAYIHQQRKKPHQSNIIVPVVFVYIQWMYKCSSCNEKKPNSVTSKPIQVQKTQLVAVFEVISLAI